MPSKRELLAQVLDRTRISDLIMQVRGRTRAPVLSVLCYHSIGDPGPDYLFDPDVVDARPYQFRQQLDILDRHCTVLTIDQVCELISGGYSGRDIPSNPVLISFDDGYRTCRDVALPILQEYGLPATFFIATDYVDQRRLYWWDAINYLVKSAKRDALVITYPAHKTLPAGDRGERNATVGELLRIVKNEQELDLDRFLSGLAEAGAVPWDRQVEAELADQMIMKWDDVRAMRDAGMDIQSHTRRHRVLQTLSAERLDDELSGSRTDLERELGETVRTVAYPVGYSIAEQPDIRAAVERAGYDIGFTNGTGVNYLWQSVDRLGVRRICMEREASMSMFRSQLAVPPLAYSLAPR